jgi:hypothetical protein
MAGGVARGRRLIDIAICDAGKPAPHAARR